MSHEASFVLPLPPSVNAAYADVIKQSKSGKLYVKRVGTKELETYKGQVKYILAEQHVLSPLWQEAKHLGYEAVFYMLTHGSDLSNRVKVLEDTVADALGFNDNRIYSIRLDKSVDKQMPRVEVHLFIMEERQVA